MILEIMWFNVKKRTQFLAKTGSECQLFNHFDRVSLFFDCV